MRGMIVEVEVSPAAVNILGFNQHFDLFFTELLEFFLCLEISLMVSMEIGEGAEAIGVAPDVISSGGVKMAKLWQFFEEPSFGFIDRSNDFGSTVSAV